MIFDNTKKLAASAVIGLALWTGGSEAEADQAVDERRSMDPAGMVNVINVSGDIEITGWDRSEVHLRGNIADAEVLDIRESDQGIRIEVKAKNERSYRGGSDLILSIPRQASLTVSGISSDILVNGLQGDSLVAETTSGDVEVSAEAQSVELKSVSGDVTFSGSSARTRAESVSGDIELRGVSGEIEATVVSGDVIVNGGSFERARYESVSGSVEVRMDLVSGGRLTAETMSGDLYFRLPGNQSGEIHAQTYSGDIDSDFGSPQSERRGPGSVLNYVAGTDGTTIKLVSFSGDIEIAHK